MKTLIRNNKKLSTLVIFFSVSLPLNRTLITYQIRQQIPNSIGTMILCLSIAVILLAIVKRKANQFYENSNWIFGASALGLSTVLLIQFFYMTANVLFGYSFG